jgi:hypothetical protein
MVVVVNGLRNRSKERKKTWQFFSPELWQRKDDFLPLGAGVFTAGNRLI